MNQISVLNNKKKKTWSVIKQINPIIIRRSIKSVDKKKRLYLKNESMHNVIAFLIIRWLIFLFLYMILLKCPEVD